MKLKLSQTIKQKERSLQPRIPGFLDHSNRKESNIDFLKGLPPATSSPIQRWYTKPISEVDMALFYDIMELKKILTYSINNLLFFAYELKCMIGISTLTIFLNSKWGPAFPPRPATRESLRKIRDKLMEVYKERHNEDFHSNEKISHRKMKKTKPTQTKTNKTK